MQVLGDVSRFCVPKCCNGRMVPQRRSKPKPLGHRRGGM